VALPPYVCELALAAASVLEVGWQGWYAQTAQEVERQEKRARKKHCHGHKARW
jgi:hypothetical protein